MSTALTIYGTSSDGHFYAKTADHFSNARNATSADVLDVTSDEMRVGLAFISPELPGDKYRFYRLALYFVTSGVPDGATIVGANVSLYLVGDVPIITGGFGLVLMKMKANDGTYPHDGLQAGDFDRTLYVGGGASGPTIIDGASGYQTFTLTATGLASWINDQGTSKFLVMSSFDVGYTLPQIGMLADFYTEEKGGSYRPRLDLTYAIPCTVTTGAATNLISSGATGHGQVTDAEGESVDGYGVIWNDDGSDPVNKASADNYAAGSDIDGSLNFTTAITGCDSGTAYYYRAYATTVAGTSVGSAVQFTTSSVSVLTVTTGAPTAVLDTTATLNGLVVDDGGDNITQRGFVYKKGGDPGTPADPTTAEAYTEEGAGGEGAYTSDITGLDEDSSYFVRAYVESDAPGIAYGELALAQTGEEAELVVQAEAGSGWMYNTYEVDPGTRDGAAALCLAEATCDSVSTSPSSVELWSNTDVLGVNRYEAQIRRGAPYFDTSEIPDNATIAGVSLSLYVTKSYIWIDYVATEPRFRAIGFGISWDSDHVYPSLSGDTPALVTSDFDVGHYSFIAGADWEDVNPVGNVIWGEFDSTPNKWVAVSLGAIALNDEGITQFCIRQYDNAEIVWGYQYASGRLTYTNTGSLRPKLTITYVVPGSGFVLPLVNIGDAWVQSTEMFVNKEDSWVEVLMLLANLADEWVEPTS